MLSTDLITREELIELSGWRLPREAGYPEIRSGVVPRLPRRTARSLASAGVFDVLLTDLSGPTIPTLKGWARALWRWRRPVHVQGDSWLHGSLDLGCARLASWLLRDGYRLRTVVTVLRSYGTRAYMLYPQFEDLELIVWRGGLDMFVNPRANVQAILDGMPAWERATVNRYPLSLLGIRGGRGSGIDLMRQCRLRHPLVGNRGRYEAPAALVAAREEKERAAEAHL